jgi:Heavy metal binding domain
MAIVIGLHAPFLVNSLLLMFTNFRSRNSYIAIIGFITPVALLSGCAVNLPPSPSSDPADVEAREATAAPLRPTLLATTHTYLSFAADDHEQAAKQIDMSEMKLGASEIATQTSPPPQTYYTCPMHPQIKEAKPGNCPICGMTLIKEAVPPQGDKP